VPLVLKRDQAPGRQTDGIGDAPAPADRSEEDEALDQLRTASCEPARDHASPGVGDERDSLNAVTRANEADSVFELAARLFGATERRRCFIGALHSGIGIGESAEPVEIEPPDMESRRAEHIAPGTAIEAMRDGKSGGEGAAMHIED